MFKALFGTLGGMTRTKYPSGIIAAALGVNDGLTGAPTIGAPPSGQEVEMLEEHMCEANDHTCAAYRGAHGIGRIGNLCLQLADRAEQIGSRFSGQQPYGHYGPPPPHGRRGPGGFGGGPFRPED